MVHKPKHKVHSFRGLLADGGEDEINLERQNLNVAYRIVKFELMPNTSGGTNIDSNVKIFRAEPGSSTSTIDFNDQNILAAAIYYNGTYENDHTVVFDNVLFSRNIYVQHHQSTGSASMNYYLEIEEVPVSASALIQIKLGTARRNIGGKIGPTPG